jgi:hypothetical protein
MRTPNLSLTEVGWHSQAGGVKFATTFRVLGLPEGDDCRIDYDGAGVWKITWHRSADLLPIYDPPYESPELALEAIRQRLANS